MREEIRRLAVIASGAAELTRNRAEDVLKELMDRAGLDRVELLEAVRSEIAAQIEGLGVATKRDVARLQRRIDRLERITATGARTATRPVEPTVAERVPRVTPKGTAAKKATRKKTGAKTQAKTGAKTQARKTTARSPRRRGATGSARRSAGRTQPGGGPRDQSGT